MRNGKKLLVLAASLIVVGMAGCATVQPGSPEAAYKEQQEQKLAQTKQVKESIAEMPEWMTEPPKDGVQIHATATGASSDMQLSIDKAIQDAKGKLADRVQSLFSEKMKKMISESGAKDSRLTVEDTQKVSSNLIANVDLAGYSVQKQKVTPEGTGFRSYVLLSYPLGEANRMLLEKLKENSVLKSRLIATEAYAELERDVQAAKNDSNVTSKKPSAFGIVTQ